MPRPEDDGPEQASTSWSACNSVSSHAAGRGSSQEHENGRHASENDEEEAALLSAPQGPAAPDHSEKSSNKRRCWSTRKAQRSIVVSVAFSILLCQFLSDHVYLWMATSDLTSLLIPGARTYCTHESLWTPFDPGASPLHQSVALLAVIDQRPTDIGPLEIEAAELAGVGKFAETADKTPAFKRLSKKLLVESIKQQMAYATFWGYKHILWEAKHRDNAHKMKDRPVAWGKLLAIQEALETYEYVLYLDMDLSIIQPMLNLDGAVEALRRSGKDLLISQDGNGVNTGVMLFRKSPWSHWLLSELWRVGADLVDCDCIFYYEQRAFHHALQTEQWKAGYRWWTRHIPIIGWFRNSLRGHPPGPSLDDLPLLSIDFLPATAEEIWEHVELVPQCAFNAVDNYPDADFIVHFAGHKGRRKEWLMMYYGKLATMRLTRVARRLREAAFRNTTASILPIVHQTWKTHELGAIKHAWHMSWRRNGFQVRLRDDAECLADIRRLAEQTQHPSFLSMYESLRPVQRADFWRYAVIYLEGGIYSDIDIGATPETTQFFLERWRKKQTQLVGIIENTPYDNSIGRFHWRNGMSPMYARLPQLRQSFFYARQGHPQLLALMLAIEEMVSTWTHSQHTDLGKPALSPHKLKQMEASGALTLELTGPGIWTDYMFTPLARQEKDAYRNKSSRRRRAREWDDTRPSEAVRTKAQEEMPSIILDTMEGYGMIRYGSMGSWKTGSHKADASMWRNVIAFYTSPVLVGILIQGYRRYIRGKRPQSKQA